MLINDINIVTFNAKQLTFDVQSMEITNNSYWKCNVSPYFANPQKGFKKIVTTLLFKGTSRENILINISKLISKINSNENILKIDDISHCFICGLVKTQINKTKTPLRYTLDVEFEGYEIGETKEITKTNTTSYNITYTGTVETPLTIIVKPLTSGTLKISGTVADIIIENTTADTAITIDSINETVKQGTTSKYADTTMWEFPKLKSSSNTIILNRASDITLKYDERYI